MITQLHNQQIKVTLPSIAKKKLDSKAASLGISVSTYLKFMIFKDIEALPEYEMSDDTYNSTLSALNHEDKAISYEEFLTKF